MNTLILSATFLAALGWQAPDDEPAEAPPAFKPEPGWKSLGRSLWFDAASSPKRLILRGRVVFREGPLEHLVCLRGTKEHEAIIATDAAPTQIHAGLLLTGVEPGGPVRFKPEFRPPHGPAIGLTVRWKRGEAIEQADARTWVQDDKTKKDLDVDWVFAGSILYEDPVTKKAVYAAEEGDLITVANFASAILDLPVVSSADDAERTFVAHTSRIPAVGTEVQLIMSPHPPKIPKTP
ncbi:YdjY domain-containing protein [Paludisphaera mucosa]|uniref:YdjY domain-containing protein n=1 Tax=Paludisphaera mucosa TaxID=3030827 RepID=A0ABT6FC49_9BACT|nr:YdjY domain-containing protein [Paludisphaera mucosa]MDG3005142.1 YdjY domain-containing protein [Paludisphaera mucosa]